MEVKVRPGKKDGDPKLIYREKITKDHIELVDDDTVRLTILTSDMYMDNATRRYTITLGRDELDVIQAVASNSG
ncbi:MAG: hypothetical protein VYB05_07775 [Pseudomonadota bacterium]|nr:hypothetical protein [Pseudomonadota bacterium]